jgi:hypothetical protein
MDANLDAETKMRLMECCGRACARIGAAAVAKSCQGNLDQWLTTMAKWQRDCQTLSAIALAAG